MVWTGSSEECEAQVFHAPRLQRHRPGAPEGPPPKDGCASASCSSFAASSASASSASSPSSSYSYCHCCCHYFLLLLRLLSTFYMLARSWQVLSTFSFTFMHVIICCCCYYYFSSDCRYYSGCSSCFVSVLTAIKSVGTVVALLLFILFWLCCFLMFILVLACYYHLGRQRQRR